MKINIIEYLESTLKIASNKIAVIDKDRQISFGELSKKSKKSYSFNTKKNHKITNSCFFTKIYRKYIIKHRYYI